ncbi:MAG: YicC family protein [Kiritimatiellae bacterium]|nr:YicC family protein [Kiritimatiellia bacterium]
MDTGINSMTGFGRGEASDGARKITVEIGSVNRKQFDCNVALPRELAVLDGKLQSLIHSRISRGYIKGAVVVSAVEGGTSEPDLSQLRPQISAIRAAANALNLRDDLTAASLLAFPDALKTCLLAGGAEDIWPLLEEALSAALDRLTAMRRTEGENLKCDLLSRLDALRRIKEEIAARAPSIPLRYRETLEKRLTALLPPENPVAPELLAREVAVFADRCDISEELTRLDSHFQQADKIFKDGGACGRTLDFLCQEMFREINTTGSKANDAEIARLVIAFKTGLEAVREQVQNIE